MSDSTGKLMSGPGAPDRQGQALIRGWLRKAVPLAWRQHWALLRRQGRDRAASLRFASTRLAARGEAHQTAGTGASPWVPSIDVSQPIVHGPLFENKLHNLRRGAALLDGLLIAPGETFSFWHSLGRASARNGFLEGRNIIDGQLRKEAGGGLCQLSSLLYHLALLGGLRVVERHPHSIDLYREEDRFTPLGADATVVWGAKDLRWVNDRSSALRLSCEALDGRLCASLALQEGPGGPQVWATRRVDFVRHALPAGREGGRVRVVALADGLIVCETVYLQKPGLPLA